MPTHTNKQTNTHILTDYIGLHVLRYIRLPGVSQLGGGGALALPGHFSAEDAADAQDEEGRPVDGQMLLVDGTTGRTHDDDGRIYDQSLLVQRRTHHNETITLYAKFKRNDIQNGGAIAAIFQSAARSALYIITRSFDALYGILKKINKEKKEQQKLIGNGRMTLFQCENGKHTHSRSHPCINVICYVYIYTRRRARKQNAERNANQKKQIGKKSLGNAI